MDGAPSVEKPILPLDPSPSTRPAQKSLGLRLVLFVALVGLGVAFFAYGGADYLSFTTLRDNRLQLLEWCRDNYALAVIGYILAYYVATMFSLPGAIWLTLSGGFLFGTLFATLYVVVGATAGAVGLFLIARYALYDYFHSKAGKTLLRMEKGFQENALSYLLVLRLVPLFPFWLVNLVPALLGVRLRTYVTGTFFGIIPGAFVYSSVGNGLGAVFDAGQEPDLSIIFHPSIITPILGLALLAMIPVFYKRFKNNKAGPAND